MDNKISLSAHAISGSVSINIKNINPHAATPRLLISAFYLKWKGIKSFKVKQYKSFGIDLSKELPSDKIEIEKIIDSKIIYFLLHEINIRINKMSKISYKIFENGNIYIIKIQK